jgi:hypothetical protein
MGLKKINLLFFLRLSEKIYFDEFLKNKPIEKDR